MSWIEFQVLKEGSADSNNFIVDFFFLDYNSV